MSAQAHPSPQKSAIKRLLGIFRWALLAAAIVFLYRAVSWNDYIRVKPAEGPYVRLLEMQSEAGPFTVLRDGKQTTLTLDEVHAVNGLPDIRYGIAGVLQRINWSWAAISLALFAPVPLMAALRLVWMLRMQQVLVSIWTAIKLTYAGNFFNFALPGSTGGDLIKAYYLTAHTHRKTEAVTVVFLDRVIGLIGLVLVAAIMIVCAWDSARFGRIAVGLGTVLGILALGSLVVFSERLRHAVGLPKLAAMLPAGQHLLRIGRTLTALRDHLPLSFACLMLTVTLQFLVMVSVYAFALALQMKGDFPQYLIYVPILFLVAALPIAPPQGFGVMEAFSLQFFGRDAGNTPAQALALALAIRIVQLVWALPGGLVPLLGAHVPRADELAEMEESDEGDASEPPMETSSDIAGSSVGAVA